MFSWQSRFATVDYPPRKEQGNLTLQFSKSVFRFHPRGRYRLSTLPLLPRFGIDCNPRHSFPFLSSPPPPFPDISYRAVSWKGRFYIFLVDSLPRIIWLDAILNCAFPIILSRLWYSMRNACSLLSPPPPSIRGSRTIIDGNFWRIEIEVLHFLTSKNLFEFIPI